MSQNHQPHRQTQRTAARTAQPQDQPQGQRQQRRPLPLSFVAVPAFAMGCLVGPDWGAWLGAHAVPFLLFAVGWKALRRYGDHL